LLVIGGIVLAPVSGGTSLGLTATGAGLGVGSGVISVTATIVKDSQIEIHIQLLMQLMERLKEKDEVMSEIIQRLNDHFLELKEIIKDNGEEAKHWLKFIVWDILKGVGYNIMYKGYQLYHTLDGIIFAQTIHAFIGADLAAMNSVAIGTASPGLNILGKTLVVGSTGAAKGIATVSGIIGIVMGTYEIVDGSKDIQGSEEADEIEKCADKLDQSTRAYQYVLDNAKNAANNKEVEGAIENGIFLTEDCKAKLYSAYSDEAKSYIDTPLHNAKVGPKMLKKCKYTCNYELDSTIGPIPCADARTGWSWSEHTQYYDKIDRDDNPLIHLKTVCWLDPRIEFFGVEPRQYAIYVRQDLDQYHNMMNKVKASLIVYLRNYAGDNIYEVLEEENVFETGDYMCQDLVREIEGTDGFHHSFFANCDLRHFYDKLVENEDNYLSVKIQFEGVDSLSWKGGWSIDGGFMLPID